MDRHAFSTRLSPMKTLFAVLILAICTAPIMAQSSQTVAAHWLAKADLAPPFAAPSSLKDWEVKRLEVRAELWKLLGRLPPRPKTAKGRDAFARGPG